MPQLQLTLETSDPETMEAACFDAGALSVTLLDAADTPILEPAPGSTPLWPTVRVVAHFPGDADRLAIAARLESLSAGAGAASRFDLIADRAWEREWLKDFRPMRFGAHLWVCPRGQEPEDPRAVRIDLDPGLAFGTGTHETTALCLTWLDCTDVRDLDVIDYGCGSGILAIAALKLGACSAIGVDLEAPDPFAFAETAGGVFFFAGAREADRAPGAPDFAAEAIPGARPRKNSRITPIIPRQRMMGTLSFHAWGDEYRGSRTKPSSLLGLIARKNRA